MLLPLLVLLQAVTQQPTPPAPRRDIADPGVIATDQRVTPAGLQSVFTGRVTGVRFGARPGEIWVTVPGALYRLGWRDNAVLGSTAFDGHSGVQGIAIDPVRTAGRGVLFSGGKRSAGFGIKPPTGAGNEGRAQTV